MSPKNKLGLIEVSESSGGGEVGECNAMYEWNKRKKVKKEMEEERKNGRQNKQTECKPITSKH